MRLVARAGDRPPTAVAVLAVGATAVAGVRFSLWMRGKTPLADYAGTELRLRAIPGHLPLTGAYSRVGWFHPGPIAMWFTWPFELLFHGPGMFVAAMVLNVACVIVCFWVAVRVWPPVAACGFVAVLGAWVVLAYDDLLVVPWNPFTTVLALLAGALCVVAAPSSPRLAYVAVAALSVAAQSHVACVAPAAFLLVAGFHTARSRWRSLLALLVLLWVGPLADLVGGSHNLYYVARDLLAGSGGRFGFDQGLRALVSLYDPRRSLTKGWVPNGELGFIDARANVPGAICLLAAIALCAYVGVTRTGATRRWARTVLAGIAVALISLTGAQTPVFAHVVEWVVLLPISTVTVGWLAVAERWPARLRPTIAAAVLTAAALLVIASARSATPHRLTSVSGDAIPAVARLLHARFGDAPIVLTDDDGFGAGYVVAVANEIERRGGHVKLDGPWGEFGKFGDEHSAQPASACRAHLLVVTRREDTSPPPGLGEQLAAIDVTDRGRGTLTVNLVSPDTCLR